MDNLLKYFDLNQGRVKVFFSLTIIFLILLSWLGIADRLSTNYVDAALLQATIAFGTARMLNALISVMQSTSVEFSFFVTGGSVGIGQVLDPINDLVEQYSSLMKLSIGSLVIQKVLLHIVSDTLFKVLITLSGLALLVSLQRKKMAALNVLMKTFVFLVFLRFSLVFVVALNGVVDHYFLVDQTRQDMATLESLPGDIEFMQLDGLSAEELAAVGVDAELVLDEQRDEVVTLKAQAESQRNELQQALLESELTLAAIETQLTRMQRLNPLTRSEPHSTAIAQVDALTVELRSTDRALAGYQRHLERIEKERIALSRAREGREEGGGFWSSVGGGMSSMGSSVAKYANPATYQDIRNKFEGVVDTILRIMTLFVLRTLILPLLFLFLLLKGFKLVWGIDLADLVKQEQAKLQARHAEKDGSELTSG